VAKVLGCVGITTERSEALAKKLAPFADKHKIWVVFHNHTNNYPVMDKTDPILAYGQYIGFKSSNAIVKGGTGLFDSPGLFYGLQPQGEKVFPGNNAGGLKLLRAEGLAAGATAMAGRCTGNALDGNPAYQVGGFHHFLDTKKKKAISVMIPYSDALMLASDWYAQLWAESLGKKALAAWRRKKSRRQGLPPPAPNLTEFLETYPQRSEAEPGSLSGNVFRFC
jgi:hypothetical protein